MDGPSPSSFVILDSYSPDGDVVGIFIVRVQILGSTRLDGGPGSRFEPDRRKPRTSEAHYDSPTECEKINK